MHVPVGHSFVDGKIVPEDWWAIATGPIVRIRWPHMLLAVGFPDHRHERHRYRGLA
jgi:hypothetical protein